MVKILLVDDDELELSTAKELFEGAGYAVATHDSPLGLSSVTETYRPDLVLLAVSIPAVGGDRVVDDIRKYGGGKGVRVIIYSARPAGELGRLVGKTGADGYIEKTVEGRALVDEVSRRLGPAAEASATWQESAVLVAVGDMEALRRLSELFTFLQLRIDIASTEDEALAMAAKNKYGFLLTEQAPGAAGGPGGIDGVALYKRLVKTAPELTGKALFLITPETSELVFTAKALGCDYLEKPIDARQFMEKVEGLRKKGAGKDRRRSVRYSWTGECRVEGSGDFNARIKDLSLDGVKVRHIGAALDEGATVSVKIEELSISREAEVKWSKAEGAASETGLSFSRSIPSTYLNYILPK